MTELLDLVPSEILSALISGAVAWAVSRHEAKKEFEKLKLTWNHEEAKSFSEAFEAMAFSVTQFSKLGSDTAWREALARIAAVRAACPEDIAYALDGLYNVVSRKHMQGAEAALTKAIEAKRTYNASQRSSESKKTD